MNLFTEINGIRFHFHHCVTGIPADLRVRDTINRPGDLDFFFDL